jgi:hypothetical protein
LGFAHGNARKNPDFQAFAGLQCQIRRQKNTPGAQRRAARVRRRARSSGPKQAAWSLQTAQLSALQMNCGSHSHSGLSRNFFHFMSAWLRATWLGNPRCIKDDRLARGRPCQRWSSPRQAIATAHATACATACASAAASAGGPASASACAQHLFGQIVAPRGAADAQLAVRDRHHLLLARFLLAAVGDERDAIALLARANELGHAARADAKAPSAVDALVLADRLHEGRRPGGAAGQRDAEGGVHGDARGLRRPATRRRDRARPSGARRRST